ncbi:CCR4-NOT transcription complex subunit 4 isoform X2 [Lingula anatina]|uniref:CCR4-NOT transcription complex subunit 4 n=1 Tax=Lingula anatina TaxID=7574 RepID=A0A1S3J2C2_LINAN|nr:CCR4-NOT transcription complex subunit 4 isoform X2 [Lingula anatina]|eukprot:XP_013404562.1 CCR4-NOT transcription complex subunit 4 isoform X2 [Lingula anatina]
MSVGEEAVECPLCMEPLEIDDINFFPCTCGYQICRFCWHRIRTDENGLCPACRKQYPEDPAEFKPLTEDELQRIRKERRQKDLQRKQKAAENRRHLANVRVVQKNLVFVVGLSQRLAEPEVLKKHEYFGKFGKIIKVVINQSTSYAGAQGPSASAYVTYLKPEDALRAIQTVNNVHVDGRTLKASLGTTKYCSHFLKGTQCPKPDCMYLHELGEEAASFTKEEMQQGKHQEYEQKLHEGYLNSINAAQQATVGKVQPAATGQQRKKTVSPTALTQPSSTQSAPTNPPPNSTCKDAWPSLHSTAKPERLTNGNKSSSTQASENLVDSPPPAPSPTQNKAPGNHRRKPSNENNESKSKDSVGQKDIPSKQSSPPSQMPPHPHPHPQLSLGAARKLPFGQSDSLSLFTNSGGFSSNRNPKPQLPSQHTDSVPTTEIPETIAVSSSTDWSAAFGFSSSSAATNDDDLGFDPWDESSKALADLIQIETALKVPHTAPPQQGQFIPPQPTAVRSLPPGFAPQHYGMPGKLDPNGSRMLGLMQLPIQTPLSHPFSGTVPEMAAGAPANRDHVNGNKNTGDAFSKDFQDGLRALLPNINISFGAPQQPQQTRTTQQPRPQQQQQQQQQQQHNNWRESSASSQDLSWLGSDPAIVTSGKITTSDVLSESPPHWMKSLHQLTEIESSPNHNHRLPFVQQFPFRAPQVWPPQVQTPPPGFQTQLRPPAQFTEQQQLTEGLQ